MESITITPKHKVDDKVFICAEPRFLSSLEIMPVFLCKVRSVEIAKVEIVDGDVKSQIRYDLEILDDSIVEDRASWDRTTASEKEIFITLEAALAHAEKTIETYIANREKAINELKVAGSLVQKAKALHLKDDGETPIDELLMPKRPVGRRR